MPSNIILEGSAFLLPYKSIAVMPAKVYIRSEIGEEKLSDRRSEI